jgi:hypothetical protein
VLQLCPVFNDLNNFPHIGALALCRAGIKLAFIQAVLGTFMGTGKAFRVDSPIIEIFEFTCFNCQGGATLVAIMVEEERTKFKMLEIYLIAYHLEERVTEKFISCCPGRATE